MFTDSEGFTARYLPRSNRCLVNYSNQKYILFLHTVHNLQLFLHSKNLHYVFAIKVHDGEIHHSHSAHTTITVNRFDGRIRPPT